MAKQRPQRASQLSAAPEIKFKIAGICIKSFIKKI
jgi:hypothetical protein